jgi:hypothetical protein
MTAKHLYRQGDILLKQVKDLPDGLKEVPRDRGRIILAEGEVTNHFHAIEDVEALFLAENLEEIEGRFLKVEAETEHEVPVFEDRPTGKVVSQAEWDKAALEGHGDELEVGEPITERVQVGTATIKGAALVHPEHDTIVLEPGNYEVVRQREYTEAGGMSFVAD